MTIVAIVRKNDTLFMMRDPVTDHCGFFEVFPGDDYLEKSPGAVIFAEYDEEDHTSHEIVTFTASEVDSGNPVIIGDLDYEQVVDMIDSLYEQHRDIILAGTATAKH